MLAAMAAPAGFFSKHLVVHLAPASKGENQAIRGAGRGLGQLVAHQLAKQFAVGTWRKPLLGLLRFR